MNLDVKQTRVVSITPLIVALWATVVRLIQNGNRQPGIRQRANTSTQTWIYVLITIAAGHLECCRQFHV